MKNDRVPAVVLAVSSTVLLTGLVIGGFALANGGGDTYTGCLNPGGEIKSVAVGDQPLRPCRANELQISWNESGPEGPPGPEGPAGPEGPEGPQGEPGPAGIFDLYQVSDTFDCDPGGGNCPVPVLVASCNPGDLATGGAAFRTPSDPLLPIQDRAAFPDPLGTAGPTGWTTSQGTIPAGDSLEVIAICADLTP